MPELELSAGTIDYQDTGGDRPAIVFSHGLVMDGSLWRDVVADLRADHRCIVPTLPFGSHTRPMRPDEPRDYIRTVCLGPHLKRLPEKLRGAYVDAVAARMGDPPTIDYVRLNVTARRGG